MKKSFISVLALSFLMIGGSVGQVDAAASCAKACHHFKDKAAFNACRNVCNSCKQACAKGKDGNLCRIACNQDAKK